MLKIASLYYIKYLFCIIACLGFRGACMIAKLPFFVHLKNIKFFTYFIEVIIETENRKFLFLPFWILM